MIFEAEDRVNVVLQNGNIVEVWIKLNRNGHHEEEYYPNGTSVDYIEFDDDNIDIIKALRYEDDEEIDPKDIKEVLGAENLEYSSIDEDDDDAYDRMYEKQKEEHESYLSLMSD